jgi:hypothetical protein
MDGNNLILVSVDDHVVEPPGMFEHHRIFSFDPFTEISEDQATAGALHALATDVDLGYRSSDRLRKEGDEIVSVLSLASALPAS